MEKSTQHSTKTSAPWETAFVAEMVRLREAAQLSPHGLARKMGEQGLPFHLQMIERIEARTRNVRLNEAIVISRVFETSVEEMIAAGEDRATGSRYYEDALQRAFIGACSEFDAAVATSDTLARHLAIAEEVHSWLRNAVSNGRLEFKPLAGTALLALGPMRQAKASYANTKTAISGALADAVGSDPLLAEWRMTAARLS